jgi:L-rhamnose-H+ transport protein
MSSGMLGIGLSVLGGVLVGNCMLPLKRIRTWPWECTWLIFSVVSLVLVPWSIAWLALPHWPSLYLSVSPAEILPSFLLGIGWGIAQVLFGIAVVRLGMALGFTLVVGLGTVFGTLIPFFARHEAGLMSRNSVMLLGGCMLMVVGVGLSGWAGRMREAPAVDSAGKNYGWGLLIAVVSGVLSSMLNLSFSFGEPLTHAALRNGAAPAVAVLAVWPVALAGGFLPNVGYTGYLLLRNRTLNKMRAVYPDLFLSLLMGLLWITAVVIYGLAAHQLGRLGDSAGWAIYQITMVLTASAGGVLSGEWKGAARKSVGVFTLGIAALAAAIAIVASSTH